MGSTCVPRRGGRRGQVFRTRSPARCRVRTLAACQLPQGHAQAGSLAWAWLPPCVPHSKQGGWHKPDPLCARACSAGVGCQWDGWHCVCRPGAEGGAGGVCKVSLGGGGGAACAAGCACPGGSSGDEGLAAEEA